MLEKEISVNWTEQIDKNGFTELRYICQCGAKRVEVYINKGDNTPISKKIGTCNWCGKMNIVPCRKVDRQ